MANHPPFSQPPRKCLSLLSICLLIAAAFGAGVALSSVIHAESHIAKINRENTETVHNAIRVRILPVRILHVLQAIQLHRIRNEGYEQSLRELAGAVERNNKLYDSFLSGGAVPNVTGRVVVTTPIPGEQALAAMQRYHQVWHPLREKLERILASKESGTDELIRETTGRLTASLETFNSISETLTSEAYSHATNELGRLDLQRNISVSLLAALITMTVPLVLLLRERQQRTDLEEAQAALSKLYSDLQRSQDDLQNQTRILQSILDSMGDGVIVANERGEYLLFNPAAEEILGMGAVRTEVKEWSEHYGLYLPDQRTLYPAEEVPLVKALRGESVDKAEIFVRHARRPHGFWLSITARPLTDQSGITHGGVAVFSDFTARKEAEEALGKLNAELEQKVEERTIQLRAALKKETLLRREIHHRVKNNLQVVSSLLFLQSLHVNDASTLEVLRESQSRTRALALIHEQLYQSANLAEIRFANYIRVLAASMLESSRISPSIVALRIEAEEIFLGLDEAIPCGLIVTELISNALKHAFPGGKKGEIGIRFQRPEESVFQLSVHDSGAGLPEGFDPAKARTLGVRLVCDLAAQLNGNVEFKNEKGAMVKITFPAPSERPRV